MIPLCARAGQSIALFGLGDSGMATARSLLAGGANVTAFDDNCDRVELARGHGVDTGDLRHADWRTFDALVLAPGVPLTHPEPHWSVSLAHGADVPIIGDIALLGEAIAASGTSAGLIAITGTNGKSTTTALIGHVLTEAGLDVAMGGNIGTPVLQLAPPSDGLHYVVECSSYQIDLAPDLAPDVGILLNLTPDHLDRHGTMAHYASVKERLVSTSRTAIVGVDDAWCRGIAARREGTARPIVRLSVDSAANAHFRMIGTNIDNGGELVASLAGIQTLRGMHNAQNALAAAATAHTLGLDNRDIQKGLSSFGGLAHRMQPVGRVERVLFVNDSKATNADATAHALASFDDIFWIAGGRAKDGGFDSLNKFFPRIRKAYLIGEAAEAISTTLGAVPHVVSETLERAVIEAARDAARSGLENAVVLLSPACASFDQFANFEVRGNAFVERAGALAGFEGN